MKLEANIVSSSMRSTRPCSAGCQPERASTICACTARAVSAVHSAGAGIGVPGRMPPREHHVRRDRVERDVGRDLGGRLVRAPGAGPSHPSRASRRSAGSTAITNPLSRTSGSASWIVGRQRRAREDAEAAHAGVDHLDVGQQRAADHRVDAVGADQHVALGAAAVLEQQPHRSRRRARTRRPWRPAGSRHRAARRGSGAACGGGSRCAGARRRSARRSAARSTARWPASRRRRTCAAAACCATPAGRARRGRAAGTPRARCRRRR